VEGDAGAPLEEEEISQLEDYIDRIKPFMTAEGRLAIEENGIFDYDSKGDFVTTLVNGKECAFVYPEGRIARCSIEEAFEKDAIHFHKPVSCHLYPVRVTRYKDFEAVNYHRWYICEKALSKGKEEGIYLFEFLKDALIRKFGEEWYRKLCKQVEK
jgi:Fe-S-cluster containining protein